MNAFSLSLSYFVRNRKLQKDIRHKRWNACTEIGLMKRREKSNLNVEHKTHPNEHNANHSAHKLFNDNNSTTNLSVYKTTNESMEMKRKLLKTAQLNSNVNNTYGKAKQKKQTRININNSNTLNSIHKRILCGSFYAIVVSDLYEAKLLQWHKWLKRVLNIEPPKRHWCCNLWSNCITYHHTVCSLSRMQIQHFISTQTKSICVFIWLTFTNVEKKFSIQTGTEISVFKLWYEDKATTWDKIECVCAWDGYPWCIQFAKESKQNVRIYQYTELTAVSKNLTLN